MKKLFELCNLNCQSRCLWQQMLKELINVFIFLLATYTKKINRFFFFLLMTLNINLNSKEPKCNHR